MGCLELTKSQMRAYTSRHHVSVSTAMKPHLIHTLSYRHRFTQSFYHTCTLTQNPTPTANNTESGTLPHKTNYTHTHTCSQIALQI